MKTDSPLVTVQPPTTLDRGTDTEPAIGGDEVQRILSGTPLVTVIGDIMLDCWLQGRSSRLAREAPVAVVEQGEETLAPGGAANTAMNLAALGARVRMVGVVGDDETGCRVKSLLAEADIDVGGIVESPGLRTTKKTRIVVEDHILLRLDAVTETETGTAEDEQRLQKLYRSAVDAMADSDALVIADYGGMVHDTRLPNLLAQAPHLPLTVVDAHEPDHWKALQPTVVTPNVVEAERTVHASFHNGSQRVALAHRYAPALREATNASATVITLDRDGAVAVDEAGEAHVTTADPVPERQASGAGDTFVAGLTMAMAADLPLAVAADFAQVAVNAAIRSGGTSLCSRDDLLTLVSPAGDGDAPRRTVLVLGHFDPLEPVDRSFLSSARKLGDYLVAAVDRNTEEDASSLHARMQLLQSHPSVDLVAEYSSDASDIVRSLRPDVIAFDSTGGRADIVLSSVNQEIPLVDIGHGAELGDEPDEPLLARDS